MMESPRPKGDNNSEKSLRNEICIRLICARPTGTNFTTPPRTKYPLPVFPFSFMETDLIRQLKYFPYPKLLNYKFRFKMGAGQEENFTYIESDACIKSMKTKPYRGTWSPRPAVSLQQNRFTRKYYVIMRCSCKGPTSIVSFLQFSPVPFIPQTRQRPTLQRRIIVLPAT